MYELWLQARCVLQWLLCYRSCCRPSFFGPIHALRFNTGAQCCRFEPCPLKQWHDSFDDSRASPFEPISSIFFFFFFFFFLFNSSVTELRNPFSHFTDQGGIIRVDRAGQFALDRRSDHLEFTFAIDQVKFDEYDFVSNLFEFHLFQNVCLWISCLSLKNVQGKRERKSFSHLVEWDKIVRVGGI